MVGGTQDIRVPFSPTVIADLERELIIGKLSITNSTPVGTFQSWSPLTALLYYFGTSSALGSYSRFRYKKIKVRVVPIGSAPVLNGATRWSALPYDAFSAGPSIFDDFRHSTIDNIMHPHSQSSELCFDIPWLFNEPTLNTAYINAAIAPGTPAIPPALTLPRLSVSLASILYNASLTACQLNYTIYAAFEGLELFHFVGSLGLINWSAPPFFPVQSSVNTWSLSTTYAYGKGDREATEKSKKGIISGIAGSVKHISDTVGGAIPNSITPVVSTIAGVVEGIASFFGFDKPTTVDGQQHIIARIGDDLVHLDGLDQSVKLNVAQDIHDDFDLSVMGATKNDANIAQYSARYGVIANLSDNGTGTYPLILQTIPVTPTYTFVNTAASLVHYPPCAAMTRLFNRWRGDMRYRLHCHMDMFSDAQLFILLSPLGTVSPQVTILPRYVQKISGSTIIEFTVPWHNYMDWTTTAPAGTASNELFQISIGLLDAVRRQGVATPGYFVLEAATSDEAGRFEVCEPLSPTLSYMTPTLLGLSKPPLGHNRDSAMTPIHSVLDLMKRFTFQANYSPGVGTFTFVPGSVSSVMTYLLSMFFAHRGSARIRTYLFPDETASVFLHVGSTAIQNVGTGVVYRDYNTNPELGIELHPIINKYWLSYTEWLAGPDVMYAPAQVDWNNSPSTGARFTYSAIGDDYFMCLNNVTPLLSIAPAMNFKNLLPSSVMQKAQTASSSSPSPFP